MSEIGIEDFTRIVVKKLEELNLNIVSSNPQADDEFPCGVVDNVLRYDSITESGTPIKSLFSISVNFWTNKLYESMRLFDVASKKLRELNLSLKGNPTQTYDEITKKYVFGGSYEVTYNGLTNSFQPTK